MGTLEQTIPIIERILERYKQALGDDYGAYRNHVYRVVHLCDALFSGDAEVKEKYWIAACFHDMGIWTNQTFDYLDSSEDLASTYLKSNNKEKWISEINLMIHFHHKITRYRNKQYPLVEIFRKADWIDVTRGKRSFELPKNKISKISDAFPNLGFHKRLIELTKAEFKSHPFKPLPMMKW